MNFCVHSSKNRSQVERSKPRVDFSSLWIDFFKYKDEFVCPYFNETDLEMNFHVYVLNKSSIEMNSCVQSLKAHI